MRLHQRKAPETAASRQIVLIEGPHDVVRRPEPPAELDLEEREVWIELCNRLPADYFPPATLETVASYCTHVVLRRHLRELIKRTEKAKRFDEMRYRRLLHAHRQETTIVQHCLRAMRLTILSSYETDRAPIPTEAPKPWEN